jgi:hypothetical protein
MNRGTFIAGLAGPARPPVLELRTPLPRTRTVVLRDNLREGWLDKVIARNRRHILQLLWPDRTPAGTIFPPSGGKRAPSLAPKTRPARVATPTPAQACDVPTTVPTPSETSTDQCT